MSQEYIVRGLEPLEPLPDVSLGEYIYKSLLDNKKHEAIVDAITKEYVTYGEILEKTTRLAHALKKCGYKKDDVFSICSENHIRFFHPVIAALYIGAVMAPLNPNYTKRELLHALSISKPKIIFCSKYCLVKILEVKGIVDHIERIIVIDLDKDVAINGIESLESFIDGNTERNFNVRSFKTVPVDIEDQLAFIMCSSGTTGLPKGVMTTHKNVLIRLAHLKDPRLSAIRPNEVVIGILPFFHGYGFMTNIGGIAEGHKIVCISRFEENLFLRTIQDYRISSLLLVPPLVLFLAKSPLVDKYDLSSVVEVGSGAAPLSKEVEELFKRRLKVNTIRQGYGLTEATLAVTLMPLNVDRHGSSGKVVSYMIAKVIDPETGKSLGPNKIGEICLKGGMVMKGYYGDEEATRNTIDRDGWLHTGDLGYYDDEEYFYVVDRLKELIKYKGYQVPPAELEALLFTNPKIKDCGVVGLPDEEAGELPLAFVVKAPGVNLTEKEVMEFVAKNVSSPKRLRGGVRFVDSIPKNPSGKILRKELRQMLASSPSPPRSKL